MEHVNSFTLAQLAEILGAELVGASNPNTLITGLNTLQQADASQASFLANNKYRQFLPKTKAGVVLVTKAMVVQCPVACLVVNDPYLAYAKLSHCFKPTFDYSAGVHPTAWVSPEAQIAKNAVVGPHCVVNAAAVIESDVTLSAGVIVGEGSCIGEGSYLYSNVSIYHGVIVGKRAIIHSGAVVGSDGFGFAKDKAHWAKIAQLGGVVIGDDVEIGANTTIDRGALENTLIGHGVKLDNQIQIAHNVQIGDRTAIAACVGIAGSTIVGKDCTLAGGVGVVGHLTLCDGVHVTAMSLVTHNINQPGLYSSGTALTENKQWRKSAVRFLQLDGLFKRVASLEKNNKDHN